MPGLSNSDLLAILDSIAQQAENIKTSGYGANTTGYQNNRTSILGASSNTEMSAASDLSVAFANDVTVDFKSAFEARRVALDAHYKRNGNTGLYPYLLAQDLRVHPNLRDVLGWQPTAAAVFRAPVMAGSSKLGSYVLSGSGVGTYTDGSALDVTKYGKMWLRLKVTGPGGGITTQTVVTVIGTKWDGSAQSKAATITAGATVGTFFNVGVLGTLGDNFKDVSSITVTGGEATDAFDIESRLERTIAL